MAYTSQSKPILFFSSTSLEKDGAFKYATTNISAAFSAFGEKASEGGREGGLYGGGIISHRYGEERK